MALASEANSLLRAHRNDEALAAGRLLLAANPEDRPAVWIMADAYRAKGQYEEALPYFLRCDEYNRQGLRGDPGVQDSISCLYWFMGDRPKAISIMRALVAGFLDGTYCYGDLAGAVTEGLLLYAMGVSARDEEAIAFALKYLRNRVKRKAIRNWPGPVARYYLGQLEFTDVLIAATGMPDVANAIWIAKTDLLKRRQLCAALFHDGIKSRAEGFEDHCMFRMRECFSLEDPIIESEWYLARYEVEQAAEKANGSEDANFVAPALIPNPNDGN